MKLYKKIIAAIFIVTLLFNIYQIFIGISLILQPDIAYWIGGLLGFLLSSSYSFWLISSAFNEARYRRQGSWAMKSMAIVCMITLLAMMFYSLYLNFGQVELIYDLLAIIIMVGLYLPIVIYDTKLISRSRSLS